MFSLPVAEDAAPAEGSSDDKPIRLDGITKAEFKRFLEVLCMGFYSKATPKQSSVFDIWFPVLKLARMWEFDAIHKYAVKKMPYKRVDMTTVEKIMLATQYDIHAWLIPGLNELAQRKAPLGMDDLEVLGPELTLKVAAVRESLAPTRDRNQSPKLTSGLRDARTVDFTSVIKQVFRISDDGTPATDSGSDSDSGSEVSST